MLEITLSRAKFLQESGLTVISIWECKYNRDYKDKAQAEGIIERYLPRFAAKHRYRKLSQQEILKAVLEEEIFGMVECDIEVPEAKWEHFNEMSPIFCTTDVPFEEFSTEMKEYVEANGLSKEPRRTLVGGMRGKRVLLATPLLKWYLEHGLHVTYVYTALEYIPVACFKEFQIEVTEARRRGDIDPSQTIIANTMKLIGNEDK